MRLIRARPERILKLRETTESLLLGTVSLLGFACELGIQNGLGFIENPCLHETLYKLSTELRQRSKLVARSRQSLLRLRIEARIYDRGIYKESNTILELGRLDINLLLLRSEFADITEHVTLNSIDVLSTLASIDTVGEADVLVFRRTLILTEEESREDSRNFPARTALLIGK